MPRAVDVPKHWHDRAMIDAAQFAAGRRFRELHRASGADFDSLRSTLGATDFALLSRVIGEAQDIATAGTNDDRRYVARQIRDALSVLANTSTISVSVKNSTHRN